MFAWHHAYTQLFNVYFFIVLNINTLILKTKFNPSKYAYCHPFCSEKLVHSSGGTTNLAKEEINLYVAALYALDWSWYIIGMLRCS